MINVLFCIQNERPLRFASALHDLTDTQIRQATQSTVGLAQDHRSNYSTYTFFEAMDACQTDNDAEEVRSAPYFSIQIDETTDITLQKTALIFVNILDSKFELKTLHWELIPLQSATARSITSAIVESFRKRQVPLDKCVLFVSDGASTMLGCRNGVSQQLKQHCPLLLELHCAPHREALCVKDAYNSNELIKSVDVQLRSLIVFLRSSKNLASLRDLAEILNEVRSCC